MTVKELVAVLKKMPQDAHVIHTMCSDYEDLDEEDITLMEPMADGSGVVCHKGHWMNLPVSWWDENTLGPRPPELVPVTVVHVRGN